MRSHVRVRAQGALAQIAIGFAVGLGAFGLPLACGAGGTLTPVLRCKLDALRVLPKDPLMVTPYDAVDIINRVHACERAEADGGP